MKRPYYGSDARKAGIPIADGEEDTAFICARCGSLVYLDTETRLIGCSCGRPKPAAPLD